ncbi:hypothetical protein NMY22_g5442 [Coprinellus aureogranulatus]|nr:hypothetical protein NMY22_g5442 [Coprinellus aureogranulatus]
MPEPSSDNEANTRGREDVFRGNASSPFDIGRLRAETYNIYSSNTSIASSIPTVGELITSTYNVYSPDHATLPSRAYQQPRASPTGPTQSQSQHNADSEHVEAVQHVHPFNPWSLPPNTLTRAGSVPQVVTPPGVDGGGAERESLIHNTLLAITNKTAEAASELFRDFFDKFILEECSNLGYQQRLDATHLLLTLAKLATGRESKSPKAPSDTRPTEVHRIQEEVESCIARCKDPLISRRSSRDVRAVVMYFLLKLSEIGVSDAASTTRLTRILILKPVNFRSPIEDVGRIIYKQAIHIDKPSELLLPLEALESFSAITNLDYSRIVPPSELQGLCNHAEIHGAGQCLRGLLFNLLREDKYDEVTTKYMKESVSLALEQPLEARVKSDVSRIHRSFTQDLAEMRLERHSQVLRLRYRNMQDLIIVAPLLAVAQTVLLSSLLPQKWGDDQVGRWTETAWTVSIVLAFAGLFIALVVLLSVLSFHNTTTHTLERIHHIMDMKEQADDILSAGMDLNIDNERSATKFIKHIAAGMGRSISEARRLDHIITEHTHNGSRFTLLLTISASCFMVAILFASFSTSNIQIWLPVAVVLAAAATYIVLQYLKQRPGFFKTILYKLFRRGARTNAIRMSTRVQSSVPNTSERLDPSMV